MWNKGEEVLIVIRLFVPPGSKARETTRWGARGRGGGCGVVGRRDVMTFQSKGEGVGKHFCDR